MIGNKIELLEYVFLYHIYFRVAAVGGAVVASTAAAVSDADAAPGCCLLAGFAVVSAAKYTHTYEFCVYFEWLNDLIYAYGVLFSSM